MKTLVISSKKENDLKVLQDMAKKMGMKAHVLTPEDREDLGLLKAMLKSKKGDFVSEEEVFKALRKK